MFWIKELHDKPFPDLLKNLNILPKESHYCQQVFRQLDKADFQGSKNQISFDEFYIERVQLLVEREVTSQFNVRGNMILLYFLLEGKLRVEREFKEIIEITTGTHNICHLPSTVGKFHCPCGKFDVFYIGISVADFFRYLPHEAGFLNHFKKRTTEGNFVIVGKNDGVLSPKMYALIEEICSLKKENPILEILIRAKVLELISYQFQQFRNPMTGTSSGKKISDKMFAVRKFILAHLNEYHSLGDLARIVGTNEFTLKKEFKEIFGKTVFGFWNDAKMEMAQKLLLENEKSIKEISELVGFKHPQHFSTAFKRTFKYTPSEFRKRRYLKE